MKKVMSIVSACALLVGVIVFTTVPVSAASPKEDIIAAIKANVSAAFFEKYLPTIENILQQVEVTEEQAQKVIANINTAVKKLRQEKGDSFFDVEGGKDDLLSGETGGKDDSASDNTGGKDDSASDNTGGKDDSLSDNTGGKDDSLSENTGGKDDSLPDNTGGKDDSFSDNTGGKDDSLSDNTGGKDDSPSDNKEGKVESFFEYTKEERDVLLKEFDKACTTLGVDYEIKPAEKTTQKGNVDIIIKIDNKLVAVVDGITVKKTNVAESAVNYGLVVLAGILATAAVFIAARCKKATSY